MSGAEETTTPTVEGEAPDTNVNVEESVEATSSESSVNLTASAEDVPEAAPETTDEQAPAAESAAPSEEAEAPPVPEPEPILVTVRASNCCPQRFSFFVGNRELYEYGHVSSLNGGLSVLEECISYGDIPESDRERLREELKKVFAEAEAKRKAEETEMNFARSKRILEQAQEDADQILVQAERDANAVVAEAKEVFKEATDKAKKLEVQVKVDRVSVSTYGSGERTVSLDGVSFTLPTSSFVSLLAGEQDEPELEDVELGGMPMSPRGGTGNPIFDMLAAAIPGFSVRRF